MTHFKNLRPSVNEEPDLVNCTCTWTQAGDQFYRIQHEYSKYKKFLLDIAITCALATGVNKMVVTGLKNRIETVNRAE